MVENVFAHLTAEMARLFSLLLAARGERTWTWDERGWGC